MKQIKATATSKTSVLFLTIVCYFRFAYLFPYFRMFLMFQVLKFCVFMDNEFLNVLLDMLFGTVSLTKKILIDA